MLPAAALLLTAASCSSGSTERPAPEIPLSGSESGEACLAWMQETLPECPEFEAWQDSTGILPPDFEALPSTNLLPDPFTFFDGGKEAVHFGHQIVDVARPQHGQHVDGMGGKPPQHVGTGAEDTLCAWTQVVVNQAAADTLDGQLACRIDVGQHHFVGQ